jgi:membrane dipeptidase
MSDRVDIQEGVSDEAQSILAEAVVWDNHACLPLRPDDSFIPELERCRRIGQSAVTVNVGFDLTEFADNIRVIAHFRHWLNRHSDRFVLIKTVADIHAAKQTGRLGVCFDLEGTCALGNQLSMIELYYTLGVRWILMAYNLNNSVGGGCQDEDSGLTVFGRAVLDEMSRVGMVPCCSHTGWKTALQVMEHVAGPTIFSHSNAYAIHPHPRNIPDELIKACAQTGGVIGINGLGPFLGDNDAGVEQLFRHIDHVAQLVGPDHVGLGLDYVYDMDELDSFFKQRPDLYPPEKGYGPNFRFVAPERLPALVQLMLDHQYSRESVGKILGANHLRVAAAVWK